MQSASSPLPAAAPAHDAALAAPPPEAKDPPVLTLSEEPESMPRIYTVCFTAHEPTQRSVDAAIETLEVFASVEWPFVLVADMRDGDLAKQIRYLATYSTLIGKIANENCQRCIVKLPRSNPSPARTLLINAIQAIVYALGVKCVIDTGNDEPPQ